MAGILYRRTKQRKQVLFSNQSIQPADTRALELKAAKEILAEVFGARPEDVDGMIQARIEELKELYQA
jgi:hypothetical protein